VSRIIVAGGGGAADSRVLDETFARFIGAGRLLYLPLALATERHARATAWVCSVFEPLGVRSVTTWSRLNESHRAQLATYDGVYVGGGNTYRLIHALRQGGLDDVLVSYIGEQAGIVVEGHAGRVCGERVLAVDGGRATRQDPGSLIGMLAHPED